MHFPEEHLTYCFDQVPLAVNLRTDGRDENGSRGQLGGHHVKEEQDGSSGVVTYCTEKAEPIKFVHWVGRLSREVQDD